MTIGGLRARVFRLVPLALLGITLMAPVCGGPPALPEVCGGATSVKGSGAPCTAQYVGNVDTLTITGSTLHDGANTKSLGTGPHFDLTEGQSIDLSVDATWTKNPKVDLPANTKAAFVPICISAEKDLTHSAVGLQQNMNVISIGAAVSLGTPSAKGTAQGTITIACQGGKLSAPATISLPMVELTCPLPTGHDSKDLFPQDPSDDEQVFYLQAGVHGREGSGTALGDVFSLAKTSSFSMSCRPKAAPPPSGPCDGKPEAMCKDPKCKPCRRHCTNEWLKCVGPDETCPQGGPTTCPH